MNLTTSTLVCISHGFLLPPDQIIPSGEEMWVGFETVVKKVIEVSSKEEQSTYSWKESGMKMAVKSSSSGVVISTFKGFFSGQPFYSFQ